MECGVELNRGKADIKESLIFIQIQSNRRFIYLGFLLSQALANGIVRGQRECGGKCMAC